jgi:hypothetical protein
MFELVLSVSRDGCDLYLISQNGARRLGRGELTSSPMGHSATPNSFGESRQRGYHVETRLVLGTEDERSG